MEFKTSPAKAVEQSAKSRFVAWAVQTFPFIELWRMDTEKEYQTRQLQAEAIQKNYVSVPRLLLTCFGPTFFTLLLPGVPAQVQAQCLLVNVLLLLVFVALNRHPIARNTADIKRFFRFSLLRQILRGACVCSMPWLTAETVIHDTSTAAIMIGYTAFWLITLSGTPRVTSVATIIIPLFTMDLYHLRGSFDAILFDDALGAFFVTCFIALCIVKIELFQLRMFRVQVENSILHRAEQTARSQVLAASETLAHITFHDKLTNLHNRSALMDELLRREQACIKKGERLGILMIDLDRFKDVNDTLGHASGDLLLRRTANRILSITGPGDFVARFGGDEFVVLISGENPQERLVSMSNALLELLARPVLFANQSVGSAVSIGHAVYPDDSATADELLRCADIALFAAKTQGRHRSIAYHAALLEPMRHIQVLQADLAIGLVDRTIRMMFQPQINLTDNSIAGFEALIRWKHPRLGWIPPDQILLAADQSNLGMVLFALVVDESCRFIKSLAAIGHNHLTVAINVSSVEMNQLPVADIIAEGIARHMIDPTLLEVEVTEQVTLSDPAIMQKLDLIRATGVKLAIDDFGIGYSSLSSLISCNFDRLKIDRSFIDNIHQCKRSQTLVRTMIAIGKGLGVSILAEGIETEAQAKRLKGMGMVYVQGYFYGKAMSEDDALRWTMERLDSSGANRASITKKQGAAR